MSSAASTDSNIFDIPDEILVKIILHLNTTDRSALSNSCKRFQRFLNEKKELLSFNVINHQSNYSNIPRNLDCFDKGELMSVSGIRQYMNHKKSHKQILKVNVRYINCDGPGGSITNHCVGKATNLTDIKIHGQKFKDVPELRTFLEPLLRVKNLSVDWPSKKVKDNDVPSTLPCSSLDFVRNNFNKLTYLAVTLCDVPYLRIFVCSLRLCQELKELHIAVVTDHSSDSYDETSNLVPDELKNLEIIEISGFKSMHFKRHFMTTLPDAERWTEFQQAKCFNIESFHLEKKNLEISDDLQEKKLMECMSHVYKWDRSKSGRVLLSERLLKAAIGITHENAPQEFCCLSEPGNGSERCALKIDEAKLLLKNPKHPISFLYLNHNIEPECDVHLLAAAFPNLTEIVLSNIITGEEPASDESQIVEQLTITSSSENEEQDETPDISTSFRMFIEKTPYVRDLTLDAYTNKLEDDKTWDLTVLYLIPKWNNLRTLRLLSIPIKDGGFLIEITKQCTQLETLVLYNLGTPDDCCYVDELVQALTLCRKLKDFAIEASNVGQVSVVFTSLNRNIQLQKVRVMIRGEIFSTVDLIPSLKQLLRRCPKLSTLVCIVDEMSKADSHELSTTLWRLKDELNRPAFKFQVGWPRY